MSKFFALAAMWSSCATLLCFATEWIADTDGFWVEDAKWNPATFPNSSEATATFGSAITASRTISVASDTFAVGTLEFDNSNSYIISGEGALAVDSAIAITNINGDGAHSIDSSLLLTSSITISQGSTQGFTISGSISGVGTGFEKTGPGFLMLNGANSYSGGTTVSEGAVLGNTTSLQGDIINNASVDFFELFGGGTYSGAMSGNGLLVLAGPELTMVLSGANSHTGGTRLEGEITVQVEADTNLGDPNGVLTFNGGTLNNSATFSSPRPIAILLTGTINTDSSTTLTLSGEISGDGSLTKSGDGTLILSGFNTYGGGTTFAGGTVQILADFMLGFPSPLSFDGGTLNTTETFSISRPISLVSSGTIDTDLDTTLTISATIDGEGSLIKSGEGILVLSGANTYAGITTVSDGTLQGNTTSLQGNITNDSVVIFNQATDGTYSGVMSGTGALIKSGGGVLMLSAANSYGGETTVSAGTLQGNTASLQGNITNDSVVIFDQATDGTYSGVMSGGGSLIKSGEGVLTLSAANSYGGETTVSAGTLRGNAVSLQGNITNDSDVIFDQAIDGTYSGMMGGSGSLTKIGAGVLTLSGTNFYSGGTIISAGTLSVSTNANLSDGGGVVTFSGGTLNTTATFALPRPISLVSSGTIQPDLATTLTLTGNITGEGSLTKSGAGVLILSGVNTYTGVTTVSDGMLQGNTTSLQGDIINESIVIFDQAIDGTYSGEMSGSGSLTKIGAGVLTLSGDNSYSSTTISAGILQGTTTSLQGNITNESVLVFNQEGEGEYSGIISDTGSVTKEGAGSVLLSGTNTYQGGTTISAGTVQIGANAGLGSAAGTITFSGGTLNTTATFSASRAITLSSTGTINTDDATTLALSGVISGAGSLTKSGAGTLVLIGTSTYSGGTTISAGTVQVGANAGLGNGAGTITFSGGTLNTTATFSASRAITLSSTGIINTDNATALTLSGVISGGGSLTKTGAGTLILSGTNTYGGVTTVSAGTLQGTTTSLQGNITNNAVVIFDEATAGEYSGVMSGSGSLTKSGVSVLALSGANTYLGGTTVSEGILLGTTASLQGNIGIANTAGVVFDQATDGEYSDVMSGSGVVGKLGVGTLTLSGTNTYTGLTTISAGKLRVMGALASALTVEASGTLSGTGTVGTTVNNGTVSPGASIGTLAIDGDYTQDAGATLVIEIDPDGNSDLLDISGTANLAGTFQLNPEPGVYVAGRTYTVLTANSISGTFGALVEDNPFTFALSYSSTTVTLSVVGSGAVLPVPISQLKGNAKKIAKYLFCGDFTYTGDLLTVTQNLTQASAKDFPEELDQLGPAQFGALPLVSLQSDTRIATTFAEYAEKRARCQTQQELVFWAEPIGYYYKESGQGQIPFQARTFGTSFGGSKVFANDLVFSGGGAYTHSKLKWKENAGTANWSTIYACPSIGWVPRSFYINGLALFAFNFYDVDRDISFPNVKRTAANTHAGMDVLIRGDAGGKFRVTKSGFFLQPEFRLSYLNIFENGYVETGAKSINLEVEKKHTAFIQPQCTLKWIKEWRKESRCFSPALYIGWLRNVPLTDGSYTSQFSGETMCHPHFTVQSFHKTTDQLVLGSELLISTPRALFVFEYEANLGYSYQVQEGKVRFDWAF